MKSKLSINREEIYTPGYVKNLFNTMSGSYERMNYITSFGFSYRWRLQFINKVKVSVENPVILDLMCGMGETWLPLKHRFPGASIHAVDFCDGMIKHANEKNSKKFNNEIAVLQEDVLQSDLGENKYDAVICGFGLKTFNNEQIKQLALQVKKILKPGGSFSFVEVSIPNNVILKGVYGFYLKYFIPVIGKIMLGNPNDYKMLWRYTQLYKNSENTAKLLEEAGLKTNEEKYFYGCARGVSGIKIG